MYMLCLSLILLFICLFIYHNYYHYFSYSTHFIQTLSLKSLTRLSAQVIFRQPVPSLLNFKYKLICNKGINKVVVVVVVVVGENENK